MGFWRRTINPPKICSYCKIEYHGYWSRCDICDGFKDFVRWEDFKNYSTNKTSWKLLGEQAEALYDEIIEDRIAADLFICYRDKILEKKAKLEESTVKKTSAKNFKTFKSLGDC